MDDLISRSDAIAVVMHNKNPVEGIENLPAVDAVEVVHAKWVVKGQDVFCSHCDGESGYNAFGASSFSDYCPNCGARMEG